MVVSIHQMLFLVLKQQPDSGGLGFWLPQLEFQAVSLRNLEQLVPKDKGKSSVILIWIHTTEKIFCTLPHNEPPSRFIWFNCMECNPKVCLARRLIHLWIKAQRK